MKKATILLIGIICLITIGCTTKITPILISDGNTYYEHLQSNETNLIGTGTITEYLNSTETQGLTYYEIIGDDEENG